MATYTRGSSHETSYGDVVEVLHQTELLQSRGRIAQSFDILQMYLQSHASWIPWANKDSNTYDHQKTVPSGPQKNIQYVPIEYEDALKFANAIPHVRFWYNYVLCLLTLGHQHHAYRAFDVLLRVWSGTDGASTGVSSSGEASNVSIPSISIDMLLQLYDEYIGKSCTIIHPPSVSLKQMYQSNTSKIVPLPVPTTTDLKRYSLNPSIAYDSITDCYYVMNRTVDYKLGPNHEYIWDGQIRTRNYITTMTPSDMKQWIEKGETKPDEKSSITDPVFHVIRTKPGPVPTNYHGWEDGRLFMWQGQLWGSFTSNEVASGRGQMVISNLSAFQKSKGNQNASNDDSQTDVVDEIKHLQTCTWLRGIGENRCQKNWVPWIHEQTLYMVYSFCPLIVVRVSDDPKLLAGKSEWMVTVAYAALPRVPNVWRGGSPMLSHHSLCAVDDHSDEKKDKASNKKNSKSLYSCIIHQSKFPLYTHAIVNVCMEINQRNGIEQVSIVDHSSLFHFQKNQIEFCAGLVPWKSDVGASDQAFALATFGVLDRESWIARIPITPPTSVPQQSVFDENKSNCVYCTIGRAKVDKSITMTVALASPSLSEYINTSVTPKELCEWNDKQYNLICMPNLAMDKKQEMRLWATWLSQHGTAVPEPYRQIIHKMLSEWSMF